MGDVNVVVMFVRVCILCFFVWWSPSGLLSGSLNVGVISIGLVVWVQFLMASYEHCVVM